MVEAQFNYFDMVVIGIMFLSCLFAFFRGFVKEILSLAAWVGAGVITVKFFPQAAEMLKPHFTKPLMAAICATIGLYIGSLIVFAIINRFIIKILKSGSEMGMFDNILGLFFGAARGAFVVSFAYFMLSLAISKDHEPSWMEQAKTKPYAEKGALLLAKLAPTYLEELGNLQNKAANNLKENDAASDENSNNKEAPSSFNDILSGLRNTGKNLSEQ